MNFICGNSPCYKMGVTRIKAKKDARVSLADLKKKKKV